jgi:prolyl-tRNA synthetase
MPVVAGEKPEHERFPGADATYSIEAMMQDGKALQAGTSHYLGTTFAEAAGIRYQDKDGGQALAHTTSWGVSTRLIGGVIMTHGDDDGLRCPPQIAPWQVVIVPMLRDGPDDDAVLDYCRSLAKQVGAQTAFGEPVRVLLDVKANKASNKRWAWVKKGAPIVEVGPRDVAEGKAAVLRRDRLYKDDGKLATAFTPIDTFVGDVAETLADIEKSLHAEATARRDAAIKPVTSWAELEAHFTGGEDDVVGWVSCGWSRPTGGALEDVVKRLKALKLTARNTPLGGAAPDGACVFTGDSAVETILIGRTY